MPGLRSDPRPPWAHEAWGSAGHGSWGGPPWARPERDPSSGRWLAVSIALVLTVLAGLPHAVGGEAPASWVAYAAGVGAALALMLVDRWPGPGVVTVAALAILSLAISLFPPVAVVPLAIGIARAVRHGAIWWSGGAAAATLVVPVASSLQQRLLVFPAVACLVIVGVTLGASIAGRAGRERMRAYRSSLEERRQTEAERERVRIARELHDVLAHSLSSISVQAGVAIHLADTHPERAQQTLRDIRATSTHALDEVRHVLGVLRGDDAAELVPEPDLSSLATLVDEARRLGLHVELDDRLEPRPRSTVQLALYRILRESITNAGRHAPASHVRIALWWDASTAVAEIIDDGAAMPVDAADRGGRGIIGMRERAQLLGGTLDAGRTDAGFAVIARIPVEDAA